MVVFRCQEIRFFIIEAIHRDLAWLWLFPAPRVLQMWSLQSLRITKFCIPLSAGCIRHLQYLARHLAVARALSVLICCNSELFNMANSFSMSWKCVLSYKDCPQINSMAYGLRPGSASTNTGLSSELCITTSSSIGLPGLHRGLERDSVANMSLSLQLDKGSEFDGIPFLHMYRFYRLCTDHKIQHDS